MTPTAEPGQPATSPTPVASRRPRWPWLIACGALLAILGTATIGLLVGQRADERVPIAGAAPSGAPTPTRAAIDPTVRARCADIVDAYKWWHYYQTLNDSGTVEGIRSLNSSQIAVLTERTNILSDAVLELADPRADQLLSALADNRSSLFRARIEVGSGGPVAPDTAAAVLQFQQAARDAYLILVAEVCTG
ncbi:hypothetical protein O7627_25040 [Solwaraspora sp. WMMD1047]|uniref:hypothetical protein n=1 Tax=Solwaraspora sp. WMMD1047 TaxID=3016102 RepID=UPI0024160042|nr:hypothetical protein [Solwaraspora sp. WMMD1047]MDG4832550.1 hypothetical protein [Solwaraspora sp. WMMD1047]